MSGNEIDDLARWFGPAAFPATVAELRGEAWAALAPEAVAARLAGLDGAERVESLADLRALLSAAPSASPQAAA
jgi:hypothetical protein